MLTNIDLLFKTLYKENDMQVTVLMPIFNAAKYLHDSIGSLLSQTCNNWKLICIDDGSTDNSKEIIESYIKLDSRISLICQENAGPAVARANAITTVNTEYISILDADDAYSPDYVELMLKKAEDTNADSIVPDVEFGFGRTKKIPNKFEQHNLKPYIIIENGEQAFSMTIPWILHGWQMIKTTLAKKYYTIENASYSKFNSDEYITRLLYLKSKKVALCEAKYLYRIAPDSLTRKVSIKKLDYLKTLDKLLCLCEEEKVNTKILVELYNDYYVTINKLLKLIHEFNDDEKIKAIEIIKYFYINSYRKHLTLKVILKAKLKTKIKFLVSLLALSTFKFKCE